MDKEKIYQKNICNALKEIEKQIEWDEKVYEDYVAVSGNSFPTGYHSGRINTLNNVYCVLRDLKVKSFHNKEFTKEEITEVLNERA